MKVIDDILQNSHVLNIPMRTRFRGIKQREALIFEGPCGWGEFSPFIEYTEKQAVPWLQSAIEAAYQGFATMRRWRIPVNITVPAVPADRVPEVLGLYRVGANPTVKVKVAERRGRKKNPQSSHSALDVDFAGELEQDLMRVEAISRYVANVRDTSLKLRIDSNGTWSYEQALVGLEAFAELAERIQVTFEYAEQPVSRIRDMARLKDRLGGSGIYLAVDENIRKDFVPQIGAGAGEKRREMEALKDRLKRSADIVIIKNAPSGGNRRALRLVDELKMPAVVSSALDTGVGLYAAARLAAAFDKIEYASGLNTNILFQEDITSLGAHVTDGTLNIPPQCPAPDGNKLKKYCADGARQRWWRERVRKVFAHIDASF